MFIYHVILPADWEAAKSAAFYEPPGLETEGFIHCSFDDQIDGVLARYYSGAGTVCILKIDVNRLSSRLVNEPSTLGESFPHVYGPIDVAAVVDVTESQAPHPNR
jgi:uncharacterized protein (DUF952 family)